MLNLRSITSPFRAVRHAHFYTGLILALLITVSPMRTAVALKTENTPLQERLQIRPSMDDVARQINQQPKWRVLDASPTIENNKTLYRFKLLNQDLGRVKVFIVDPDDPLFRNLHLGKSWPE